ncbi:MAG: ATP-binding protein [Gordonia polyisoprenivorans]|nr:ATP-binding protein [Gordonia polyisoprenivorans]
MPADPSPAPGTLSDDAERKLTRQFAVFLGAGYLTYLVTSVGNISGSLGFMQPWWAIGAPVAVFGSGLAIGLAGIVNSSRGIRRATAVNAIVFLVAVLSTPLAWTGVHTTNSLGLWYAAFLGLVAVALGLQPGMRPFAYLAVVTVAVVMCNTPVKDSSVAVAPAPDIAFAFAYCLPFVCCAVVGVHTARVLDRTRDETYRIAADTAAAQARSTERARFDALTHDGIMATLLGAARMGATDDVRALAQRTLEDLAAIAAPVEGPGVLSAVGAAQQMRAAAHAITDSVPPRILLPEAADTVIYPDFVVSAISAALGEALRNSIRHAGAVAREVSITLAPDSITASVEDLGPCFEPRSVPPHRLGIAASIVGRMRQIPGGTASVDTKLGRGTTVRVSWER